ncbi:MAG: PQQ-binding-like beta-propeller repeat protein [Ignavibacterium sp.]|jgi:outer membrane protein assembly factor BamB|nr:PQQ-binding-like beta-propeller repeat protein [Ignavibacterium sp.]
MIKKIMIILLLTALNYAQQQTDIPWPTLANTDWPMIKHDPQFTGRSPYRGPQRPTVIWTVDMPYGIFSGPVIGKEDNLYFGSYYSFADNFYCYTQDGNLKWDYSLGRSKSPASGILIDSTNTIYFGSSDNYLYALNSDGTFKWEYETLDFFGPTLMNIDLQGNLYSTNNGGKLFSFNPSGDLNFSVTYESGFNLKSPVLSTDGNTIYIAGKDSNLFALNLDGTIKWKFECSRILTAPMVDSYDNIYFIDEQSLFSIYPNSDIRWEFSYFYFGSYSIPTIDYEGNIYAIATDTIPPYYKLLISLDFNGNYRWKYSFDDEESDDFWQPLICDSEGTVYVGSTLGYNYYAISSDGKPKWKLPLIEQQQQVDNTGAISKDGTLYLGVHDVSLLPGQQKTLIAIKDTCTVSVDEGNSEVMNYFLSQNYPNPFNPTTTISYQIKKGGLVQLKVYDVLGKEVATLVKEEQTQGNHSVKFNGSNLPSGMYVYSLHINNFIRNRKMILLK